MDKRQAGSVSDLIAIAFHLLLEARLDLAV